MPSTMWRWGISIRPRRSGGAGTIRYCGAPLAYSVSEAGQEKSVTIAELGKKGEVTVRTIPLSPLRRAAEDPGQL